MCGDHGKGQAQAQLDRQNQIQQDQLNQQKAIRDQVMGGVGKYLSGNIGFDPGTLAAMKSQFLNQNASNYGSARSNIMSALASRGAGGGQMPVGGDFVRQLSGLEGMQANTQASGILGLNIQNAQQAINNQFNAANVAGGQTAQLGQNIGTFGQGASNALDQYVKAASVPGFMSNFAQGLGSGLGSIATGGIGGALGGIGKYLGKPAAGTSAGAGGSFPGA